MPFWEKTRRPLDDHQQGMQKLGQLLGKTETVVRHHPGDVLVLTCRDRLMDAKEAELLEKLFDMAGVEYGAVVVLGPGMSVDKIDMEKLIDMSRNTESGESANAQISQGDGPISTAVKCPRCHEPVELPLLVSIADDNGWMTGRAKVDQFLLSKHAKTCSGVSVVH